MGIEKLVDAHGMTREGASPPIVAFSRSYFVYFLVSPRPRSRISFPHHSQVAFHASKQWEPHAPPTANLNQQTRLIGQLVPAHSPFICSALCPGGLCRFSCAVLLVQFGFFFSRTPQQHMPAVVISNPSPLRHFKSFFLSPVVHNLLSRYYYSRHVSFLFLFSHFPPFSFILLPSFPSANKQELGKFYFYFFFFVSFSVSVPSIRNRKRTSYL